jgi:hypothetical protein
MNKIYTSALAVVLAGSAMAQNGSVVPTLKEQAGPDRRGSVPVGSEDRGATIWSNDFSDATDWVIAHDGPLALDWQIGIGLEGTGDYPTPRSRAPRPAMAMRCWIPTASTTRPPRRRAAT